MKRLTLTSSHHATTSRCHSRRCIAVRCEAAAGVYWILDVMLVNKPFSEEPQAPPSLGLTPSAETTRRATRWPRIDSQCMEHCSLTHSPQLLTINRHYLTAPGHLGHHSGATTIPETGSSLEFWQKFTTQHLADPILPLSHQHSFVLIFYFLFLIFR